LVWTGESAGLASTLQICNDDGRGDGLKNLEPDLDKKIRENIPQLVFEESRRAVNRITIGLQSRTLHAADCRAPARLPIPRR
jgi:hypothetical protein